MYHLFKFQLDFFPVSYLQQPFRQKALDQHRLQLVTGNSFPLIAFHQCCIATVVRIQYCMLTLLKDVNVHCFACII